MSHMELTQKLRIVDGGKRSHLKTRSLRASRSNDNVSRIVDFLPIALLGVSAGVAGVVQIVMAVAR